ncbi:hypothetical protein AAF712_008240 [Marasmius tenuissimus]|uniref:Uncharacterized protein n=1 Tax=Marasmius tenuissimus TaxID=585030 RepID=A0ABR2ZU23_9AGAR
MGGMTEFTFEVVKSRYSDFAFELECKGFKWRWETCFVGHKLGSEIISQHLVLPLISVNHLAFASTDPVGEITESELEKAIDKVGRTARRTIDTHIKNAVSKPRLASTLRRMTAMFNSTPELPPVESNPGTPDLEPPSPPSAGLVGKQPKPRAPSPKRLSSPTLPPEPVKEKHRASPSPPAQWPRSPDVSAPPKQPVKFEPWTISPEPPRRPKSPKAPSPRPNEQSGADSATESDDDDEVIRPVATKGKAAKARLLEEVKSSPERSSSPPPAQPKQSSQGSRPRKSSTEPESSPPRPAKKKKPVTAASSDDSGEEGSSSRRAPVKTAAVKRGTRQPIKRGGKRF